MGVLRARFLAGIAALGVLLGAAAGDDVREVVFDGCAVRFRRADAALAQQVGRGVGAILKDLNSRLGVHFRERVRVRLAVSEEEFRAELGGRAPEWILAAAMLERREIVVRADRLDFTPADSIWPTLRHELCHLALHEAERGQAQGLPVWFHEGVACYLSGRSLFTDWRVLETAAAQGALIPLDRLREGFPTDESLARLAYLQSEGFVRFVAAERSGDAIRWILDAYRESGSFDAAVERATGESLASLERRWRERGRSRFPWLKTLWQATTLFGVLAVATVAAYAIRRARARRTRLEWEREDWRLGRDVQVVAGEHDEDHDAPDGTDDDEDAPWR